MNTYFYELFENIPRQGPGLNSSTRKAYHMISKYLPPNPEILDIGCGKGVQTLELARMTNGQITALDNHSFFLKCLEEEATKSGLSGRINPVEADMNKMPFKHSVFDVIWAEGAVFIIGIKEGLKSWKKLLKKDGFLVLSDLVWFTESRPDDLTKYLEEECLYVLTINQVLDEAATNGYSCISHFTLPSEGWTKEYFLPQKRIMTQLREKYSDSEEAQQTYKAIEFEHEMMSRNLIYAGYEFFIFRND